MARITVVTWGGGGNVSATLPIVTGLVARGHTVEVLGDVGLAGDVAPTGANFVGFRDVTPNDARDPTTDALRDWHGRTPVGAMRRGMRLMFGEAAILGREVVEAVRTGRSDVAVVDCMLPGALMGAEAAAVRCVSLVHSAWPFPVAGATPPMLGDPPRIVRSMAGVGFRAAFEAPRRRVTRARADLGLAPAVSVRDQFLRCDRMLVLTSPTFDPPPRGLPTHARYVGPALTTGARSGVSRSRSDASGRRVLISLSTTFQDQGALLQRLLDAVGSLDLEAVVTSGPIDPVMLRVPENAEVVPHLRHDDVLAEVDAVVTHAGHGTVITALAHGRPVLCLPHGRDQPGVAARAERLGAGIVRSRRASTPVLAAAMSTLVDEPALRAGAERVRAAMAAEGDGCERSVREIESLLSRGPGVLAARPTVAH